MNSSRCLSDASSAAAGGLSVCEGGREADAFLYELWYVAPAICLAKF